MRIAWVSAEYPPYHQGGIGTYSLDIVTALRKLGHTVHIFCYSGGKGKKDKFIHHVINNKKAEWDFILYSKIKKVKPDVVHVQHEYGMYLYHEDSSFRLLWTLFKLKMDNEFPIVITYHSVYTVLDRIMSYYMDISLKIIDAGIVHEQYQMELLPINIDRVANNVYVIPHGAKDIKPYKNAKRELGLQGKKVVGMIGWWGVDKGFHRVVNMWEKIVRKVPGNVVLVVAGGARPGTQDGANYRPILINSINRSKAKNKIILIEGSFSPERYDQVLSAFDVMILPYRRASQSGNLAHGFALGVPAIVTAMEGLKAEVENSGAGIAVQLNDEALAEAIISLMNNEKLRKGLADKARKYVTKNIKWQIVARKHVSLYNELIKYKNEKPLNCKTRFGYQAK